MWTKRMAIREADEAVNEYQAQAQEYRSEINALIEERSEYEREYQGARLELMSALLGDDLDEARLERLGGEWGAAHLGGVYRSLSDKREVLLAERDELKVHDVIQSRYELLEADSARYVVAVKDARVKLESDTSVLKGYETVEFLWLYERGCHELRVESGLMKLWKVVTLKAAKEKRCRARVAEVFQGRSLQSIAEGYVAAQKVVERSRAELLDAERVKADAVKLVKHFEELNSWEFDFEGILRRESEKVFGEYFQGLSPDAIMAKVPDELRGVAAKIHALFKKFEYASNLIKYLENEEEDRYQRVTSISRVSQKWRRNPSGRVRGDKSKWLQQIPAMKREGTKKRLGWSRKMRSSMHSYDDYECYGAYHRCAGRDAAVGFLAYDVFNHGSSERMPYEGFGAAVVPEITEFRESHGADDWLKDVDTSLDDGVLMGGGADLIIDDGDMEGVLEDVEIGEDAEVLMVEDFIEMEDEMEAVESILDENEMDDDAFDDES